MNMTSDIDFVIPWVDGSDPEWQKQKALYCRDEDKLSGNAGLERYRDWGILRYWFRAVERYAPWVRMIHFVTCGQLPEWLNINHPKINFVRHEDYIPQEYLPTFSSHVIELNFFRIKDLSEKFVYFNDDMFLNAPVKTKDFFMNDLPCSCAGLNPGPIYMGSEAVWNVALNNILAIQNHFNFREQFKKNISKWLNLRYGAKVLLKTIHMLPYSLFSYYLGFHTSHSAASYLKSTFIEVWEKEPELLNRTCTHRFRDKSDVNQWLMEWWQVISGKFYPRSPKYSRRYHSFAPEKLAELEDEIKHTRHKAICINDDSKVKNFDEVSGIIRKIYSEVFPEKSEFEK